MAYLAGLVSFWFVVHLAGLKAGDQIIKIEGELTKDMSLVEAVKKAGADREKARAALETIKGFAGTGGVFNMSPTDHNGLGMDSFEMLTVKNGAFVKYTGR